VRWSAAGGKLCVPEPGSRSLRNDSMSGPPGRSGLLEEAELTYLLLLASYLLLLIHRYINTDR